MKDCGFLILTKSINKIKKKIFSIHATQSRHDLKFFETFGT